MGNANGSGNDGRLAGSRHASRIVIGMGKENRMHLLLPCLLASLIASPLAYSVADYRFEADLSMYDAAEEYLLYLRAYTHNTTEVIRVSMGVNELKAGISEWRCTGLCWFGGPGYSISPGSGYASLNEVAGIFLNSATISTLSAYFMHYTLRYITGGFLLHYLAFGLILRSLSFTRSIGSTLIAIVLSLYLFYPFMLMLDSMIFPAVAGPPPDPEDFTSEWELGGEWIGPAGDGPGPAAMARWAAYSFFGAVFLPAINLIVITVLAREVGRVLGEEIDISRLSQMV